MIPWVEVAGQVSARVRGSIKMVDYPELKRFGGVWDFRFLKEFD
jgi:hypothetical protein